MALKKISFVLASRSKYRKKQLRDLGIVFRPVDSHLDEDFFKNKIRNPKRLTQVLAQEKAWAVYQKILNENNFETSRKTADFFVVGSDQVAHLGGKVLGKAGNYKKAVAQLKSMCGKKHQIITSICLLHKDKVLEHTDVSEIEIRKLTDKEIRDYVRKEKSWDCAGSYKIESLGLSIIKSLKTEDPSAIVGLPMIKLIDWLRKIK